MTATTSAIAQSARRRTRPLLQMVSLVMGLLILVPAATALVGAVMLGRTLPWQFARPLVTPHVLIALAMLGLGVAQLALPKGDRRHRLVGYAWCVLFAAVCLSGLFIQLKPGQVTVIHLVSSGFAVGNLLLLPVIVWAARTGRRKLHRYAVLTAFWFMIQAGALTYIPTRALGALVFGLAH